MIAAIQTQEAVVVALEKDVTYTIVQDVELANVGGGCTAAHF